jgi:hypothetical protein
MGVDIDHTRRTTIGFMNITQRLLELSLYREKLSLKDNQADVLKKMSAL